MASATDTSAPAGDATDTAVKSKGLAEAVEATSSASTMETPATTSHTADSAEESKEAKTPEASAVESKAKAAATDTPEPKGSEAEIDMVEESKKAEAEHVAESQPVMIAGHTFPNRESVQEHVRKIQDSASDDQALQPADALFLFHLASFQPSFEAKLTAPVVGFKYGSHSNGLKCFLMLRSDGSEEGISISKCLNGLLPKVAGGTKRPREQDAEAAQDAPAAKKQQGLKIRPGCVVVITGIPKATQYQAVRTACEAIGDCRFVETNEKPKKKKGKGKGKAEDEGKGKAKPPEDADSDGEDVPLIAKARFGDAEGAAKAVKELKEIGGAPVTLRIMEGEEEREFWEKLLERADKKFVQDQKGKKGKGRGKA